MESTHALATGDYGSWGLLDIGRLQAHRQGLTGENVEDCASGFAAHMLAVLPSVHAAISGQDQVPEAWLMRCAINWTKNFARDMTRLARYEVLWSEISSQGDLCTCSAAAPAGSPLYALIVQELYEHIRAALSLLTPQQQYLFAHYYLTGESVAALASEMQRSPGAVRQALSVLRRRLLLLLEQQGVSEQEARNYLYLLHADLSVAPVPRSGARSLKGAEES